MKLAEYARIFHDPMAILPPTAPNNAPVKAASAGSTSGEGGLERQMVLIICTSKCLLGGRGRREPCTQRKQSGSPQKGIGEMLC